ncbi:MAG: hypothetical protein R6U04_01335 [Bacteroidales bacterium]
MKKIRLFLMSLAVIGFIGLYSCQDAPKKEKKDVEEEFEEIQKEGEKRMEEVEEKMEDTAKKEDELDMDEE